MRYDLAVAHIVVIGGGISGLAAAHFLKGRGTVLEASPRLGGKILTQTVAGLPLEAGPDGFLADPGLLDLCADLGLQPVQATSTDAYFLDGAGMRPLVTHDMRHAGVSGHVPPRFFNLPGGLDSLVTRLAEGLDVRLNTPATRLIPAPDGGMLVNDLHADAVIVTLPAPAAARLLQTACPAAAAALAAFPYLDLGVVTLVYPGAPWTLAGSGFLAAARPGHVVSGCTYLSVKWPHVAREGLTTVRATVGGSGDRAWAAMSDDALIAQVHRELTEALGPAPVPEAARVVRWPEGISDHRNRDLRHLEEARAALAGLPVLLAAGGYMGGGMTACVAEAARAAEQAIAAVG
ncbi:MAG TPA: FAD-dependent oxidoreductase [Bacillota bacterium]|nr:FAD-dependent oxidoreductase [Bacillota bacterium]